MYDEWGVADGYFDIHGVWKTTSAATIDVLRRIIGRPGVDGDAGEPLHFVAAGAARRLTRVCRLILEDGTDLGLLQRQLPADVPIGYHTLVDDSTGQRVSIVVHPATCPPPPEGWGLAAQVYSLWRPDGWGIGDLRDVSTLSVAVAAAGGVALLLSPLHAPAPSFPQESSPYYPSSRQWLNPLLISLDDDAPPSLDNVAGGLIDRDAVWRAKRARLATRFAAERGDPRWRAWAAAQGEELAAFCRWNALAERFGNAWWDWPADQPDTAADEEFHAWCQYTVAEELASVAAAGVGLIGDLAVGCAPGGADCALWREAMALGVSIGAPPDLHQPAGQVWGLPPFVPWRTRALHYRPFIAMVRSAMRSMAGLRIDHVMGLFRQYWVPEGLGPKDGGYVRLPHEELMAIIRLEAHRAGVYVVGEDLGTVEEGVRAEMRVSGMFGTTVWWFEPDTSTWPAATLGTITTHDLPTVLGVATGVDGADEFREALAERHPDQPLVAVHADLASSPARLVLATTDDLAGQVARPNLPGTTAEENPNWCRRLPTATVDLLTEPPGKEVVAAITDARRTKQSTAVRQNAREQQNP